MQTTQFLVSQPECAQVLNISDAIEVFPDEDAESDDHHQPLVPPPDEYDPATTAGNASASISPPPNLDPRTAELYPLLKQFPPLLGLDFTIGDYKIRDNPDLHEWRTAHIRMTMTRLRQHFDGEIVVALIRYKHSKIFVIDIDCHSKHIDPVALLQKVVEDLGQPFYVEKSTENGGYHLWYEFDDYVFDEALKRFRDVFGEKSPVQPIVGGTAIRIPWSKQYKIAGTFDPDSPTLVDPVVTDLKTLLEIFYRNQSRKKQPIPSILRQWNRRPTAVVRPLNSYNSSSKEIDFSYGEGQRNDTQIRIAFNCLRKNMTEHEFYAECQKWDRGSKDMKLPEPKKTEMLHEVWSWACEHFQPSYQSFFSSTGQATEAVYYTTPTCSLTQEQTTNLVQVCNYGIIKYGFVSKKLFGKCHLRTLRSMATMFQELWKQKDWRHSHNRDVYDDDHAVFNGSVPFSKKLQQLMAKATHISNPSRTVRFLVQTGLIKLLFDQDQHSSRYSGEAFANNYQINDPTATYGVYLDLVGDEIELTSTSIETHDGAEIAFREVDEDYASIIKTIILPSGNIASLLARAEMSIGDSSSPIYSTEWENLNKVARNLFNTLGDGFYQPRSTVPIQGLGGKSLSERLTAIRVRNLAKHASTN